MPSPPLAALLALASLALPGVPPRVVASSQRLEEARAARSPTDRVRTRDVDEDGRPRYVNHLILETSPYLQQHAHDPVS
jgi:hypothetical protein